MFFVFHQKVRICRKSGYAESQDMQKVRICRKSGYAESQDMQKVRICRKSGYAYFSLKPQWLISWQHLSGTQKKTEWSWIHGLEQQNFNRQPIELSRHGVDPAQLWDNVLCSPVIHSTLPIIPPTLVSRWYDLWLWSGHRNCYKELSTASNGYLWLRCFSITKLDSIY